MAATAALHARPSPGRDFAVPSPAVQRLGLPIRGVPAPRFRLALCWTTDRAGLPAARRDAEPPD